MINKKIIFILLFCMPKIFGMQASVNRKEDTSKTIDQTINYANHYQTLYGSQLNYYYNQAGTLVISEIAIGNLPTNVNSSDFPQLASLGLLNNNSNSNTINQNNFCNGYSTNQQNSGNSLRETQAQTVNVHDLRSSNSVQGKQLSVGNSQANASIPMLDAIKFVCWGIKFCAIKLEDLIKSHRAPEEVSKNKRVIKSIIHKDQNSEEFKAFRSELNKKETDKFKSEINKFLQQYGVYPTTSIDVLLASKFLLSAENMLLDIDIKNLYKSYPDSYIKDKILEKLALAEEKKAQNDAAISVLNDLLNKTNDTIKENKSNNTNIANGKSDYEIKLNIFLNSRFSATVDGFETKELIKNVKKENETEYKKNVRDKIYNAIKEKLTSLAQNLDSTISSLSLEQLEKLAISLEESITGLEIAGIPYKKTRDALYDEYYNKNKDEATRNILAVSEEQYDINTIKTELSKNSLLKIKAAIKIKNEQQNSESSKSSTTKSTNSNKKTDSEIKLDIFLNEKYKANGNCVGTAVLINSVKKDTNGTYKKEVRKKIYDQIREKLLPLAKDFYSTINSLTLEQIQKLAINLENTINSLKYNKSALKNNRNYLHKKYYKDGQIEADRNALALSEENYATNKLKTKTLDALLSKLKIAISTKEEEEKRKALVKQKTAQTLEQINTENSSSKTKATTTQDRQINRINSVSITLDDKTTIQVPIAQIRNQSLSDANKIAQEDVTSEQSNNLDSTEPTQENIFFYEGHEQNVKDRKTAAAKDIQTGGTLSTQNYILDDNLKQALINIGLDPNSFTTLTGSASQQVTQQQILQAGALIATNSQILGQDITLLGLNFIGIANIYNATGNVIKANGFVDFCNGLTAIAKGGAKGLVNVLNPIRMAEGFFFLGKAIVEATETAMLGVLANCPLEGLKSIPSIGKKVQNFQDNANKLFLERLNTLKDNTSALAAQLKLAYKNSTRDQLLENGTAIIVETLLTGKVQKCYYKFLKNQVPKIANFAKRVAEAKRIEDVVITTAEGIELTLTAGTVEMLEEENIVANALEQNANSTISQSRHSEELRRFYKFLDSEEVANIMSKNGESLNIAESTLSKLTSEGFLGDKFVFSEKYWNHVFGMECKVIRRSSGAITMQKSGCHQIDNLKHLNLQEIIIHENKCILGKIKTQKWNFDRITNQGRFTTELTKKTLFPTSWSKAKVADKIIESLNNINNSTKIIMDGDRIIVEVFTLCGIKIKHVFDKYGKLITSFPVLG